MKGAVRIKTLQVHAAIKKDGETTSVPICAVNIMGLEDSTYPFATLQVTHSVPFHPVYTGWLSHYQRTISSTIAVYECMGDDGIMHVVVLPSQVMLEYAGHMFKDNDAQEMVLTVATREDVEIVALYDCVPVFESMNKERYPYNHKFVHFEDWLDASNKRTNRPHSIAVDMFKEWCEAIGVDPAFSGE